MMCVVFEASRKPEGVHHALIRRRRHRLARAHGTAHSALWPSSAEMAPLGEECPKSLFAVSHCLIGMESASAER